MSPPPSPANRVPPLAARPPPQDMAAVDDARRACQAAGQEIPEGFVRIVQMRAARANATRA